MMREDTIRGLAPAPHERADAPHPAELEALRARRCLDALWMALTRRMGTDELDELLLDARHELEIGRDWSDARRQVARGLADELFKGEP